jgi:hypothetical protein
LRFHHALADRPGAGHCRDQDGGASAGLAKALRLQLERLLPQGSGGLALALSAAREAVRARFPAQRTVAARSIMRWKPEARSIPSSPMVLMRLPTGWPGPCMGLRGVIVSC